MTQGAAVLILVTLCVALIGGAVKAWIMPDWWDNRVSNFVYGTSALL